MSNSQAAGGVLVCPLTKQSLTRRTRSEVEEAGLVFAPRPRVGGSADIIGHTNDIMVRQDGQAAFPIVEDVPVLLAPEMLVRRDGGKGDAVDIFSPVYQEAYAEMAFYNAGPVEDATAAAIVDGLQSTGPETFPDGLNWLDARYDCRAQYDCYQHLGPMTGRVALQVGGAGLHAVKFLLAGATHAYLVTPMITEARRARWLAARAGVEDRLHVALGMAEELPLRDASIDAVFAGGCVHHMLMTLAMPEINRIMTPAGRFAAAEPWRAPLYGLGTRVFGKREANAHCSPLTGSTISEFERSFARPRLTHHGTLLRYPLLALAKLGLVLPLAVLFHLFAGDDVISSLLGIREFGSSVVLTGYKQVLV